MQKNKKIRYQNRDDIFSAMLPSFQELFEAQECRYKELEERFRIAWERMLTNLSNDK